MLEEASFKNIAQDVKGLSNIGEIKVDIHRMSLRVVEPPVNPAKKAQDKDASSKSPQPKNPQIPANVHEKAMKGEVKSHGIT